MSDQAARPAPDVGRLDLSAGYRLLAAGMLLWTLALAARWPLALSFGDEVGYVGQAKLFLEGKVRPGPDSAGVWAEMPAGLQAKYPLLGGLLLVPLFAAHPRFVFLASVVSALAIAWVAGRALAVWGRSPAWGLVVLLHPTVTLLARTAMTDLPLAALTVGAWWSMRRERPAAAAVLLAIAVALKANGLVLGLALVGGEGLRVWRELLARDRRALLRVGAGAVGVGAGLALSMALSWLASGKLWFSYGYGFLKTPPFWYGHFPTTAPHHVRTLLLLPPLLAAGVWPFWRRRELGPVLVIAGLTGMMCFYYFVDTGRSWAETLVLSPRLILPAVAFLLIGWAELLAALVAARPRLRAGRPLAAALVAVPALLALAISVRHRRWQEPEGEALAAASRLVAARGEHELGLTAESCKIALLYPGRTPALREGAPPVAARPGVVLCGTRSWSYRTGDVATPCNFPGYAVESERDGFQLLVRTNGQ
jgi:hypothetical protein